MPDGAPSAELKTAVSLVDVLGKYRLTMLPVHSVSDPTQKDGFADFTFTRRDTGERFYVTVVAVNCIATENGVS